jgi:hypothetical protein
MIPEFAIIGHPNEGKSSVLSTLAEDDSVRISPIPGETTECRTFPVLIDGVEILRFTDTPGFQNPRRVLHELQKLAGPDMISRFRETFGAEADLHHDCELLLPVARGAGIIYVVDGSRPVRNVDRSEMEILRLTGRPRMAVINCKDEETAYLDDWRHEFRKTFNANRIFNAHRATYAERILLLEALKNIDQDWHGPLDLVVSSFKKDWAARNDRTAEIIIRLLTDCVTLKVEGDMPPGTDEAALKERLGRTWSEAVRNKEKAAHRQIRSLFKHNIFNYDLPPCSILHEDLFNEKTWRFLGLSKGQIALAGGLSGAAVGAGIDLAHVGVSLGLFAALGGAIGTAGALLGGRTLSTARLLGVGLGGERLEVGMGDTIQFFHVLLDRALLFYAHVINWAHGRRDLPKADTELPVVVPQRVRSGQWPAASLALCREYFQAVRKDDEAARERKERLLQQVLTEALMAISCGENRR